MIPVFIKGIESKHLWGWQGRCLPNFTTLSTE